MIKIEDRTPSPEPERADIHIDGRHVGTLKACPDLAPKHRWLASIEIKDAGPTANLAQGLGPDKMAAIQDAFTTARRDVKLVIERLDALERRACADH